ncbi:MAG TPA: translation initiation factor IF-2 [Bryobacteraceae bacterium]|nr:translation initiation factor IF-2 [Bryobacteraceae bacterium]
MKKIRINELARELEVKPGVILDLLPEFGVNEKKTHSSSIDEDVALEVRHRLVGEVVGRNGGHDAEKYAGAETETARSKEKMTETSVAVAEPPAEEEEPARAATPAPAARPAPIQPAVKPPVREHPPQEQERVPGPPQAPEAAAPEPERPRPFQPLRPPVQGSGGAIHPPLASGSSQPGPVNRSIAVPARPIAPPMRSGLPPTGPRQPLPPDLPRPALGTPARPPRPTQPVGPAQPASPAHPPVQAKSTGAGSQQTPPTHVVLPGAPSAPAVPGAPVPRPPGPSRPNLIPGAPIAPRPPSTRLVGQPAARPVVPPRADVLARLQQQQPRSPMPGAPRPTAPRPGAPTPGQPIFRAPMRPGQPQLRGGPGLPSQPFGPRRPGQRPMHPTTPLRPESATPPPTDQRRHQGKPGGRPRPRPEDREEGILRQRAPKRSQITPPPPIDREITVAEGITVKELSEKLGVKANLVIKKLVERKIFATINQTLDVKLAEEISREFGASTNKISFEEESTQDIELAEEEHDLVRRAPIVTVMGHVDHGKTSLLDAIRETRVADREAGGITQHIGAYHVEKNGRKIVFIDTPGHQAFTRMRARGAKVTDIVVLVVAADDGVMPQTLEAIDHAKAAGVPMLVAINKIDKPGAQPDRIKQQLSDRGLLAEDWGGDTVMVPVSAKAKQNLDLLLEMILLVADLQDLKANPGRPALATVLEAKLDKGRGPVATVLVRNGTLRAGDFFICGSNFSKVRAMFDDRGNAAKDAEPSMPVEVIGFDDLPEVGDTLQVVTDTAKAKQIVTYRESKAREVAMAKGARVATLDSLAKQFKEGDLKDLNLIVKADVGGTAEVLTDTLQQLSTDKIRVRVLRAGVGAITEDDVLLASASQAVIIGFNVKPERSAQSVAEQQKVDIRQHSIIYELIDEVRLAMTGMLEPVFREVIQGHAEIRETFRISKIGVVAGCFVTDGAIRANSEVRVLRGGDVVHRGKIEALKRFKNDASEVKAGLECGISIVNYNGVQVGDIIEAFMMERMAPTLSA